MSSYYNNGPRIFTPSTLKTTKNFAPVESFGTSTSPVAVAEPSPVNTCHRARGVYLQHSHPRAHGPSRDHHLSPFLRSLALTVCCACLPGTYALLRQAEAEKLQQQEAHAESLKM